MEKGLGEEGTRIVSNAAQNHYEPLRSALGAFVGETAFIGNCNLIVEGTSDQILIAGAARLIREMEHAPSETLDLNSLTVVPCSSASHVPYVVFLARGRDYERPALLVLLDSDDSGKAARKQLARGGPYGKQLLESEYIALLGDVPGIVGASELSNGPLYTEDLVPLAIAREAAQVYAREFYGEGIEIDDSILRARVKEGRPVVAALEAAAKGEGIDGFHIEKVGLARAMIQVVERLTKVADDNVDLRTFFANMRALCGKINAMRREAEKVRSQDRVGRRVEREKKRFLADHPTGCSREEAALFVHDLRNVLDDSRESDAIRAELNELVRAHKLKEDLGLPVERYDELRKDLERVQYAPELSRQRA